MKDVKKLGYHGDIVEVSPGYARNYLFPQRFAQEARGDVLLKARKVQSERIKSLEEMATKSQEIAASLKGLTLKFVEKIAKGSHLYGSVAESQIAAKIKKEAKLDIRKEDIEMAEHIKEVGKHMVKVNLPGGVVVAITVEVEAAGGEKDEKKKITKAKKEEPEEKEEKAPAKKKVAAKK
jgi:large subunit ribosomal protein L9